MIFIALTSTSLILRPVSSLSSSRRNVSISGSSAIVVLPHCAQRDPCRSLLGFLLRTAPSLAVLDVVDDHRGEDLLRVVRTVVAHVVARPRVSALRGEFLQSRLVIARTVPRGRMHD